MNPGPRSAHERLVELETRYAFLEDLVERLDRVVLEQGERIDRLRRELATLREELRSGSSAEAKDQAPEV